MTRKVRATSRPTAVSLFSGAGGLDVGLERAGFEVVAALDIDRDCVETLRVNQCLRHRLPNRRALLARARILEMGVETATRERLAPPGAPEDWCPDLLVGGPPCQSFSSSGKMGSLHDPRGRLFEQFVRLAAELRPRVILFENVRGLVTARDFEGRPGGALMLVKRAFEGAGYATSFALLNAADFGLPQRRVRMFMLATRAGKLPLFPEPTHAEDPTPDFFNQRRPWATLGGFLASRPKPEPGDVVVPTAALATALATVSEGGGLKSAGAREATRPGGHWGYRQGTFVADLARPARTVTGSASQDWVRLGDQLRRLTWRECASLQGFPEGWVFAGSKASRFLQVGNAVPAVFGEVLGHCLLRALESSKDSDPRPASAPLPASFTVAVEYTSREQARNGPSRQLAKTALSTGSSVESVKGLGSAESRGVNLGNGARRGTRRG